MTLTATDVRTPGVYPLFDDSITDWALDEARVDWSVVPDFLGPVWDRRPDWPDHLRDPQGYILPEFTLGYQAIDWVSKNLLADEVDEHDQPLPFKLTAEQARFILWFYAVDEDGRFLYREIVLQRLKGWG